MDGSHNRAEVERPFEQLNISWDPSTRLVLSCTTISAWRFPLRDIASTWYLDATDLVQPLHTTISLNVPNHEPPPFFGRTHGPSERQKLSGLVRADQLPLICLIRSLAVMHLAAWGFNTSIDTTVIKYLAGPSIKAPMNSTYDLVYLSVMQLNPLWLARGVRALLGQKNRSYQNVIRAESE